jgi:hypothetical protein
MFSFRVFGRLSVLVYIVSVAPTGTAVVNCSKLKTALLSAEVKDGFLCLSGSDVFPVSLKESTNAIPSKLMIRAFHGEVKLILKKLRSDGKAKGTNGGAILFGPSGTGKSWAGEAVLVDELRDAQVSGKTVVYYDSVEKRAFVFSKERTVLIQPIFSGPNVGDIPELMVRDTVLIYDAARGTQDALTSFPCEYLIFSSPNAGNFKQVADNNGLVRFVCPNWTVEELKMLEHGYGDRFLPQDIESRLERLGGFPPAVVAKEGRQPSAQGSSSVVRFVCHECRLALQSVEGPIQHQRDCSHPRGGIQQVLGGERDLGVLQRQSNGASSRKVRRSGRGHQTLLSELVEE